MRQALAWMMATVLCCAAGAMAGEERTESQLEQAQEAYERATKLYETGRYADALIHGRQALALTEAVLGGTHLETARCLDLLGVLHRLQGNSAEAEPLLLRGLELREAALDKRHPDIASSLDHLASLYKAQGLYDRAVPLYERALAIQEKAHGQNHPQVAVVLSNLARLYSEQGQYERAEPLYKRALAIQQAAHGKDHPQVASSLNNLASLYMNLGSYERAEPLAVRALFLQQRALPKNHPDIASSLNNLALIFARQGDVARAEPRYRRALAIIEATQGRNHPYVADLLINLAQLRLADDRLDDALPLLQRAFAISELRLRREALDFSESRLTAFMAHLRTQEELLYELQRANPTEEEVRHLALTAALLRKGRSVEETADTSRTIHRRVSAQDRDAFERLRGLRSQLATLSLGARLAGARRLPAAPSRARQPGRCPRSGPGQALRASARADHAASSRRRGQPRRGGPAAHSRAGRVHRLHGSRDPPQARSRGLAGPAGAPLPGDGSLPGREYRSL